MYATINFKLKFVGRNNTFEFVKTVNANSKRDLDYKIRHYQEMYDVMGLEYQMEIQKNEMQT